MRDGGCPQFFKSYVQLTMIGFNNHAEVIYYWKTSREFLRRWTLGVVKDIYGVPLSLQPNKLFIVLLEESRAMELIQPDVLFYTSHYGSQFQAAFC